MRYLASGAAGICLLAMSLNAGISQAAGATEAKAPVVVAQNEAKKDETVKQKVKRVWRNLTGYKFAVACPALIPFEHKTCTQTGKNREAARAKCISANPLCSISDVN
jgi:negative regulator of replication initiation